MKIQNDAAAVRARPETLSPPPPRLAEKSGGGIVDELKKAGKSLEKLTGFGPDDAVKGFLGLFKNDREKLKDSTRPFRDTLSQSRLLKEQLSGMDPSDPRYAEVKAKFEAADRKLQSMTGYTTETAPKPGSLWVDPQYMSGMLRNGTVSQSQFPVGQPVTEPPRPVDALLQRDGQFQLFDSAGQPVTVTSEQQYRDLVAASRAEAGMPVQGGDPIGVHMSLSGGGGKGKRFASVISEMYRQGVVPVSVSGNSVGAIAAGLLATGADPVAIDNILKDPNLEKLKDWDLKDGGGAFNGNYAFNYFDQKLRQLTGITDRPVTFADLKMPLQLIAATMTDSAPDKDLSKAENRVFVFSQETTPDTPVALAIQASIAMPGIWDPVQMVDPVTGREMTVVDGGVIDAMPMDYNHHKLPEVGLNLLGMESNHPGDEHNTAERKPLPKGDVNVSSIFTNAINGYKMNKDAAANADDFRDRTAPEKGEFMMNIPVWNLKNPHQQSTLLGYAHDPVVDPILDAQGRQLTQQFLRGYMDDLTNPQASGTNVTARLPEKVEFSVPVENQGRKYQATYSGGDSVHFQSTDGGKSYDLKLGRQKIEAIFLDHLAFQDLPYQLSYQMDRDRRPIWEKVWDEINPL